MEIVRLNYLDRGVPLGCVSEWSQPSNHLHRKFERIHISSIRRLLAIHPEATPLQFEVDPISWTKFRPFLDGVAG
jgi:hypothetical protein